MKAYYQKMEKSKEIGEGQFNTFRLTFSLLLYKDLGVGLQSLDRPDILGDYRDLVVNLQGLDN